jgi:predicted nucleic acid-binding protein
MPKAVYLETSCLLSVLFREKGYEKIASALESSDFHIVTSKLTLAEAHRAVSRAVSKNLITEASGQELRGTLAVQSNRWDRLEIDEEILRRTGDPFPREPVRTLDAIHLASALLLKSVFPEITVLSSDQRILSNLAHLGLEALALEGEA